MYKYILKRFVMMIPVLLGISIIIFTIISLTPGNPARLILGERASQEAIDELNEELGYYDPLPVKYVNYMIDLVHGDLGESYRTGGTVVSEIAARFPTTLLLSVLDIFLTAVISIPLGVYIALKKNSIADNALTILALVFTAMPSFWLGMILILTERRIWSCGWAIRRTMKLRPPAGCGQERCATAGRRASLSLLSS